MNETISAEAMHIKNSQIAKMNKINNISKLKMTGGQSRLLKKMIAKRYKTTGEDERTVKSEDIDALLTKIYL